VTVADDVNKQTWGGIGWYCITWPPADAAAG